jgi:hypothetical protein
MSTFSFHSYTAPLPALGTEVTTVILENFAIVMTYAFSQEALVHFYNTHFKGNFRFLQHGFSETPQKKATRSLVELAVMYRALDDAQDITRYLDRDGKERFGDLYKTDGKVERLPLRELPNKIIHADKIEWEFEGHLKDPLIVCHASQNQQDRFKWTKARIPMSALAKACCGLAC